MKILTGVKAENAVKRYVPIAKSTLTKNVMQAVAVSKKFPLVLKLVSSKAVHKTEVSGVRIVNDMDGLRKEYADLMKMAKRKRLKPEGILVQEFVKGEEVIIGIRNDQTFGHVLAFGIGGIYVEIMKDVAFRACPITSDDADSMIEDLRMKQILYGARGSKKVNIRLLKKVLVKVSQLPQRNKKIEELDINPFIINDKTGKAVDVRIVLG